MSYIYPKSVGDILQIKDIPAVSIDQDGIFVFINEAFEKAYGWSKADLMGKLITTIIPDHMKDSHNIGFSRFIATEKPTVAGQPLPLPVLSKDGKVISAEHFILGEKKDGKWVFAATIDPDPKTKTS
jgi:PAS domain S-box-containing protein